MKYYFFSIILFCVAGHGAVAQQAFNSSKFEILEIEDALSTGDFLFAYERALPLANAGHPAAQFILGTMNQNGWGMPQNYPQALQWYSRSGIGGNADGAYNAGVLSLNGRGTEKNINKAVDFFNMAAALNHTPALYTLGIIFGGGHGIEANLTKSFDHFVKAGQLGHPTAIYQVGQHFATGQGTEQDFVKARQWFEAACTYHVHQAQYELAMLHLEGRGGEINKVEGLKWLLLAQDNDRESYVGKVNEITASLTVEDQNQARDAAFAWLSKFPKKTD